MPYYLANGRQYFDGESSGIFYSNPYIYERHEAIYFQPQVVLFGLFTVMSPDSPGLLLAMFGLVVTVAGFWVLGRLVEDLCPGLGRWQHRALVVTVAWGGGLLCLASALYTLGKGMRLDVLRLDPSHGWWFLNFGRNFVYPTEGLYHLIVLLMLWAALRGRHVLMLLAGLLLAVCHPYTGIQYAIIVLAWVGIELMYVRSGLFRWRWAWLYALPLAYSLGYYGVFLMSHASHRELVSQWALDWSYKITTIVPAYILVFSLFTLRCRTPQRLIECFSQPFNRLLGLAAILSFGMANHEAFVTAHQPLHFTRGHIWLPLCLLGLPALVQAWQWLAQRRALATLAVAVFFIVMLSDNAVFFAVQTQKTVGIYTRADQLDTFRFIRKQPGKPVVLSKDPEFAYLSATYSQARPYYGHYYNALDIENKSKRVQEFFDAHVVPDELRDRPFWVLAEAERDWLGQDARFELLYENDGAAVYRHKPEAR